MKKPMWRRLFWLHINMVIWALLLSAVGWYRIAAFIIVIALFVFSAAAITMFIWAFRP